MREIKFRGKSTDGFNDGEWVYGLVQHISPKNQLGIEHPIGDKYGVADVDPATVGQYTGLRDSKRTEKYPAGQEIYEGDIIQMPHEKTDGYFIDENGMWRSVVVCGKDGRWESDNGMGFRFAYGVEVIGNIHDNPELLEGRQAG